MPQLHIVQGGIKNGDKAWLQKAARDKLSSPSWVAPKSAMIGDEVVIFVPDFGFFATGQLKSLPKPRVDWPNRYGSGLTSITLIEPPISLATIRRHIPRLTWANYPRSITTPSPEIAEEIRKLVRNRQKTGIPDLDDDALAEASLGELRTAALMKARRFAPIGSCATNASFGPFCASKFICADHLEQRQSWSDGGVAGLSFFNKANDLWT